MEAYFIIKSSKSYYLILFKYIQAVDIYWRHRLIMMKEMKANLMQTNYICSNANNSKKIWMNQSEFDDWCNLSESEEELELNSSVANKLYSNSINQNVLLTNKGNIKPSEKKEFVEDLMRQYELINEESGLIKLNPWLRIKSSNTSNLESKFVSRNKRARKTMNSRIVKRSITVSPAIWFGPKIASPTNKKQKQIKTTNKKKISSSTLKSKQTNFSSSKGLRLPNWKKEQPLRSNSRSKSSFVNLWRIPEIAEKEDGLLTIMDI